MMKHLMLGWAVIAAVAACAGDPVEGPTADAPPAGAFGATCTAVTDTGSTECDSGVCSDAFEQIGHNVCSVKCTPGDGSTCPQGSEGMKCNMKGYCKP